MTAAIGRGLVDHRPGVRHGDRSPFSGRAAPRYCS